jgi:hypothetical protein
MKQHTGARQRTPRALGPTPRVRLLVTTELGSPQDVDDAIGGLGDGEPVDRTDEVVLVLTMCVASPHGATRRQLRIGLPASRSEPPENNAAMESFFALLQRHHH